jgi:endonuclease YncB( thermonuclease family)
MRKRLRTNILYGFFYISFIAFATFVLYQKVLNRHESLAKPTLKENKYQVVRIIDGDTFVVQLNEKEFKIRLAEIDAPEMSQYYGRESKYYLSNLLQDKYVFIENKRTGKYGRIIGDVYLDSIYINAKLVKNGIAWSYYYKNDKMNTYQTFAQKNQIGLWSTPNPQPPWIWRKNN